MVPLQTNTTTPPRIHCFIVICKDPRTDDSSLEGLRCATGLASDHRWRVSVGFCESSLGFVREDVPDAQAAVIHPNPILKQWIETGPVIYCLESDLKASESLKTFTGLKYQMLSPSEWLELGMKQHHILMFGGNF